MDILTWGLTETDSFCSQPCGHSMNCSFWHLHIGFTSLLWRLQLGRTTGLSQCKVPKGYFHAATCGTRGIQGEALLQIISFFFIILSFYRFVMDGNNSSTAMITIFPVSAEKMKQGMIQLNISVYYCRSKTHTLQIFFVIFISQMPREHNNI